MKSQSLSASATVIPRSITNKVTRFEIIDETGRKMRVQYDKDGRRTEWVIAAPKKMRIEPEPPPPPPVYTCVDRLNMFLAGFPGNVVAAIARWRTDPKLVDKTPVVTVFLLEGANVLQIWRMIVERSAEGQSITGWLSVNVALFLWLNFYLVFNRENKFAIWGTAVGIVLNALVVLTVVYFRYFV